MLTKILNNTFYRNKYQSHPEAVIVSCFFNPQKSEYRTKAYKIFYDSIKHLNHRIVECVIGDAKPELKSSKYVTHVKTENMLWHKETLLNGLVKDLPKNFKYVFWIDTDVIFTNKNWLVEGVEKLKTARIIQPFKYCVHLEKDELEPSFEIPRELYPNRTNKKVWRSFLSTRLTTVQYDDHGHVGFAWGAQRRVLDAVPLYDRALIGGADHIIAHAATGQINHDCVRKAFRENIDEINEWSRRFYKETHGMTGHVDGDLYHIWHGDIENRQYLRRIHEFNKENVKITERDRNGLFVTNKKNDTYVRNYIAKRESGVHDDFLTSAMIGYATDSTALGTLFGGNLGGALLGDALRSDIDNSPDAVPVLSPEPTPFNDGNFS